MGNSYLITKFFLLEDRPYRMIIDLENDQYKLDSIITANELTYTLDFKDDSIHVSLEKLRFNTFSDSYLALSYTKLSKQVIDIVRIYDSEIPEKAIIKQYDNYQLLYMALNKYRIEKVKEQNKTDSRVENEWTLEDVILPNSIKLQLLNCINRMNKIEAIKEMGCYDLDNTILLTGPNGCGKTAIAKSLCNTLNKKYIYRSAASLAGKYVGTSAKQVRELFEDARKHKKIIILDEFESVSRERSESADNGEYMNLLNELLIQLDGFDDNTDVIFIAMTNRKDLMDKAILRRFKLQLEIPIPDRDARKKILELYIAKIKHDDSINVDILVDMTKGVNGSFLRDAVNQAGFHAVDEDRKFITQEDLVYIINNLKESRKTGKEKKTSKIGFN